MVTRSAPRAGSAGGFDISEIDGDGVGGMGDNGMPGGGRAATAAC